MASRIQEVVAMDQVNISKILLELIFLINKIDSITTTQCEINFFFPEFDYIKSICKDENLSLDQLKFDRDTFEHYL